MSLTVLPQVAMIFMLIFGRLGGVLMLMPALGEQAIPTRLKLVLALAITFTLFPVVSPLYGALPASVPGLAMALGGEILIGLSIGLAMRFVITALQIAGNTIAMQLSLSFAEAVDPSQGTQAPLVANFLTVTAITLIFVLDLHHLAIAGMIDSFALFQPGALPPFGDFSAMAVKMLSEAFRIGVQVSAPFIVFGLIFQLGLGVLSRLMPQIQVYFIAMPAGIAIGFLLLALLIATIMAWYAGHIETAFGRFLSR